MVLKKARFLSNSVAEMVSHDHVHVFPELHQQLRCPSDRVPGPSQVHLYFFKRMVISDRLEMIDDMVFPM